MSCITYHEIIGNDVFERLKADGVIHEGDLYSPIRGKYVHFEHVFDYTMCDADTLQELDEREAEAMKRYKEYLSSIDMPEKEIDVRVAEMEKCDHHMMPVFKSKSGGVAWTLNYDSDDLPTVAVGRMYPDDIFEYYQETEGHFNGSCKFRCDQDVTEDGRPYDDALFKIPDEEICDEGNGTSCISLYLDPSDKEPAKMYCENGDIKPTSYQFPIGLHDIVIRDKSQDLTVYRTLGDGTESEESWPVEAVKKALLKHREMLEAQEAQVAMEEF